MISKKLKKFFKSKQPSGSSSDPSTIDSDSTASPREPDSCATAAASSECPPKSEQQSVPPLRGPTALPARHTPTETYEPDSSGPRGYLRPMSPSKIREHTHILLERRLTPEELQRVNWKKYEGITADKAAKNIEDLKTTLGDKKEHSKTMNNILQCINKYCAIVDIAIQQQPDITALVWAGARTLIQVSRTPNSVISERRSHSLTSWRPIAMKPL